MTLDLLKRASLLLLAAGVALALRPVPARHLSHSRESSSSGPRLLIPAAVLPANDITPTLFAVRYARARTVRRMPIIDGAWRDPGHNEQ